MVDWAISVLDALSQFVGRFLFVRVQHKWVSWTLSPNESISGAAYRWYLQGEFGWVRKGIDGLFFFDKDHCRKAYDADYRNALRYTQNYEF